MTGPADEDRASAYAELLRRTVHQPVQVGGEEITRGISLGVALGDPGTSTVSDLMSHADQAMLQAKSRGGNGYSVFTADMRRQNEIRTGIELHLAAAIRRSRRLSGPQIMRPRPSTTRWPGWPPASPHHGWTETRR